MQKLWLSEYLQCFQLKKPTYFGLKIKLSLYEELWRNNWSLSNFNQKKRSECKFFVANLQNSCMAIYYLFLQYLIITDNLGDAVSGTTVVYRIKFNEGALWKKTLVFVFTKEVQKRCSAMGNGLQIYSSSVNLRKILDCGIRT